MKLYYHKTSGGAEYLCSEAVEGTNEGSFEAKYIIRIDGDIKKDAELLIKEDTPPPDCITEDDFTRVNSDINGNPRYVIHFMQLLTASELNDRNNAANQYAIAVKRANKIGGSKYRGKDYGGGIVFQSYCLPDTIKGIEQAKRIDNSSHHEV